MEIKDILILIECKIQSLYGERLNLDPSKAGYSSKFDYLIGAEEELRYLLKQIKKGVENIPHI